MSAEASDADLLRAYLEKGDAAFGSLVQRYLPLVYHAARRQLGSHSHAAEDVTQSVFVLLARKAPALAHHGSIAGWLHATTRYMARDAVRAEVRRQHRERQAQLMNAESQENLRWERLRPVIDDALGELRSGDREVVLLRYFVGLSFGAIGARLGLAENTARMRVERALAKLERELARRGIRSTGSAVALALGAEAIAGPVPPGLALTVQAAASTSMTGAAGGVAAAIGFMAGLKTTAGMLTALALVATLGLATYQANASRNAALELATTQSAAERLDRERDGLLAALKGSEAKRLTSASPPTGASGAAPTAAWDNTAEGAAFMARHPEVREALMTYAKARARFRYRPMYTKLNLTPEQIDRFEWLAGQGIGMGTEVPGNDQQDRQLTLRAEQMPGDERRREIAELLGSEGLKLYRETDRANGSREIVVKMAGALWFSETPLSPEKAEQLVDILVAAKGPSGARDWNRVFAEAKPLLTPEQFALLESARSEIRFDAILDRQAKQAAGTGNPGEGK